MRQDRGVVDGVQRGATAQVVVRTEPSAYMLDRDGTVLATTGPVRPSEAKLRRAQTLAHASGAALHISRELISRKLSAQEDVARHKLLDTTTANTIAGFRSQLPSADSINSIRLIESRAARSYWQSWSTLPINFPKNRLQRVPAHWLCFGAGVSPITRSPRLACNPPNAGLNFLYALAEAGSRLAVATLGLGPGLGVLHTDTSARDSLACVLMEPVRPHVDAYVLDSITGGFLNRDWFAEQRDGNRRLVPEFAAPLSETASMWYRQVAPVAEWVARAIWSTIRRPDKPFTTRLTQDNKRAVKGAPAQSPIVRVPSQQNICVGCGKAIRLHSRHCPACPLKNSTASLIDAAKLGRVISHTPQTEARRRETKRLNDLARSQWSPSKLPSWLTEEVSGKDSAAPS